MTNRHEELTVLLARLRVTASPDRKLDADIAVAVANTPFIENLGDGKFGIAQDVVGADFVDTAPNYTTTRDSSIELLQTMINDSIAWEIVRCHIRPDERGAVADAILTALRTKDEERDDAVEECAKVCEGGKTITTEDMDGHVIWHKNTPMSAIECADAIRFRKGKN